MTTEATENGEIKILNKQIKWYADVIASYKTDALI